MARTQGQNGDYSLSPFSLVASVYFGGGITAGKLHAAFKRRMSSAGGQAAPSREASQKLAQARTLNFFPVILFIFWGEEV